MDPETAELLQGLEEPPDGHEYVIVESETGEKIVLLVEEGADLNTLNVEGIDLRGAEIIDESVQLPEAQHHSQPGGKPQEHDSDHAADSSARSGGVKGPRILQRGQNRLQAAPGDSEQSVDTGDHLVLAEDDADDDQAVQAMLNSSRRRAKFGPHGELAQMSGQHGEYEAVEESAPCVTYHQQRRRRGRLPNRTQGQCICPECGEGFINTARLERHLAVHQVFGSYLCPLCGKTYKYEYNLFFHWRNTCSELDDIKPRNERTKFRPAEIKVFVDKVVADRIAKYGTALGQNKKSAPPPPSRRGVACGRCGLVVMAAHHNHHAAVHQGAVEVDGVSHNGGFFCELCGLMFRARENLLRHWRTGCPEIQVTMDPAVELTMDDDTLKGMIVDLLRRKTEENQLVMQPEKLVQKSTRQQITEQTGSDGESNNDDEPIDGVIEPEKEKSNEDTAAATDQACSSNSGGAVKAERLVACYNTDAPLDEADIDVGDVLDDDLSSQIPEETQIFRRASGAVGSAAFAADEYATPGVGEPTQPRTKWSMNTGPVQCPTCFRSFANAGRLERHIAGFHNVLGNTHTCILCGNRFKYDYNLLYHYRHSCPYTKAFIDKEIREQMDAHTLRRLVRGLAQKEVRLTNDGVLPNARPPMLACKQEEMAATSTAASSARTEGALKNARGEACPVCGVFFYGDSTLQRHIRLAHSEMWSEFSHEYGGDAAPRRSIRTKIFDVKVDDDGVVKTGVKHVVNKTSAVGDGSDSDGDNIEKIPVKKRPPPRRHAATRPSCEQCGEVLPSQPALRQHVVDEHGGDYESDDDSVLGTAERDGHEPGYEAQSPPLDETPLPRRREQPPQQVSPSKVVKIPVDAAIEQEQDDEDDDEQVEEVVEGDLQTGQDAVADPAAAAAATCEHANGDCASHQLADCPPVHVERAAELGANSSRKSPRQTKMIKIEEQTSALSRSTAASERTEPGTQPRSPLSVGNMPKRSRMDECVDTKPALRHSARAAAKNHKFFGVRK